MKHYATLELMMKLNLSEDDKASIHVALGNAEQEAYTKGWNTAKDIYDTKNTTNA